MRLFCPTALVFLLCAASAAKSQQSQPATPDTTTRRIVHTRDGSTLVGRVVSEDSTAVQIETSSGVLTIAQSNVLSITTVRPSDMHEGEYWFPDPNRTRLFFAPTGRMLDRGEVYYMNTYLLLHSFVGGLDKYVTVGGGLALIPGVDPKDWVYYFTPKIGVYQSNSLNLAVGGLIGFLPIDVSDGPDESAGFGILYGVATEGGPNGSVTAGLGYGYSGTSFSQRPVFMLGGERRVSRRVALLSENYLYVAKGTGVCIPESCTLSSRANGLVSYGVRFLGEKLSVDFAFFNGFGQDVGLTFPGIPYLSFGVKF